MAKKSSLTKSLEVAQREAAKQLLETRRRIRKQPQVSPYEYCLLHEDEVGNAHRGADRINIFMEELSGESESILALVSDNAPVNEKLLPSERGERLILAIIGKDGIRLLPDGTWSMAYRKALKWNNSSPLAFQCTEHQVDGVLTFRIPLYRYFETEERLLVVGEQNVAERLLPWKEDEKSDRRDRFNFFYQRTRDLGYELRDGKFLERVEEERERVRSDCSMHLRSLAGVLNEFFVDGARAISLGNKTGDGSATLVRRAHSLAQEMSRTRSECRLYRVDTEESREIAAFGKRWIKFFNLHQEDTD